MSDSLHELERALIRETAKKNDAEKSLEMTREKFVQAKADMTAAKAAKDKAAIAAAAQALDALERQRSQDKSKLYEAMTDIRDIENAINELKGSHAAQENASTND